MSILRIENLSKKFSNKTVLDNISLSVGKAEIVGFVGNNGVGKTTTIKCILNEINYYGSIFYNNELIKSFKQLSEISLFPDLNTVPLNIKAFDYIRYISKINFIKKSEFKIKMEAINKILNIEDLLNSKISKLSSGQKKQIIFASVLIKSPDLIILDEPTANLDVQNRNELIDLILKMNKMGITLLITSHILEELQEIINHLIILDDHKIVYDNKFDKNSDSISDLFKKYAAKKVSSSDTKMEELGVLYEKR